MENLKILLNEEQLQKRIAELAEQLDKEYEGKEIVVVSILKGALYFTIDLTKKMKTTIVFETIHAHSYEENESTGNVIIKDDISTNIEGKDVLIIEDIIDTGRTLDKIRAHLLSKNPKSLKIAVLINKPQRRIIDVPVDYIGFNIENKFIIGYGFDYDNKYRNLPYIGYIE